MTNNEAVARFVSLASEAVLCSDFDGTLAPIVADPLSARPDPFTISALELATASFATVAVISGRPAAFLREALGQTIADRCYLFGRYGAELAVPGEPISSAGVMPELREAFALIAEQARAIAPNARVEDKGESLALHWREDPASADALTALAIRAAHELDLEIRYGKLMVDLVERGTSDKGQAIERLLPTHRAGCFIGDDIGDLAAFNALEAFEANGGVALKVAVASEETPSELTDRADLILDSPMEVAGFLWGIASD